MAKGLLILLIVFAGVGMLHLATLRLIKTPEHKKQKIPMQSIGIVIDKGAKGLPFGFSQKGLFAKRPAFTYGK